MSRDFQRDPVRVVHLIHTVAHGGVETILVNWFSRLRGSSVDVRLACFANPDGSEQPFLEACARADIPVDTIPWARHKPVFKSARALGRILDAHRAEILHTHNTYADFVALIARRGRRLALASSVYVWSDFGWKRNLLQALNKLALQRFDCVISQCEATRVDLIRRGLPEATSRVVISGFEVDAPELDASERAARRAARGIAEDTVLFANVARCYPEKAQDRLLEMFAGFVARHPQAHLWLYGTGPLEEALKAQARALKLGDSVEFMGFAPDIDTQLQLADVQLHPSYAEGVPLAVCSGMAAGLPLVASAVGGIPEMVAHETNGLLIPGADDPDFARAFTAATERLLIEPDTRHRLGAAARAFMRESYSMEAALRQLTEVYRSLLPP